jgi:hypothetical protein
MKVKCLSKKKMKVEFKLERTMKTFSKCLRRERMKVNAISSVVVSNKIM